MNFQEQMDQDWRSDLVAQGHIQEALDALGDLLTHFEWRKDLSLLQDCIQVLEDEDARIVRRWD